MLPSGMRLTAIHEPRAKAGSSFTPLALTWRSLRGKLYLITSPGCTAPFLSSAESTAFQSWAARPLVTIAQNANAKPNLIFPSLLDITAKSIQHCSVRNISLQLRSLDNLGDAS